MEHSVYDRFGNISKPEKGSFWVQFKRERACKKNGGHHFHPDQFSMINWFCCMCSKEREGNPYDGS